MKLLDQVHEACVTKHYSLRTDESYTRCINDFLRFHSGKEEKRIHPRDMTVDQAAGKSSQRHLYVDQARCPTT